MHLTFDCSQNIAGGGSAIGIFIPEVVLTQGSPEISGQNEDVLITLNFQAQAIPSGLFGTPTVVIGSASTV